MLDELKKYDGISIKKIELKDCIVENKLLFFKSIKDKVKSGLSGKQIFILHNNTLKNLTGNLIIVIYGDRYYLSHIEQIKWSGSNYTIFADIIRNIPEQELKGGLL